MMKGHLRHGTETVDTGGGGTEVGVASRMLPEVQAVLVGESLSTGLGT